MTADKKHSLPALTYHEAMALYCTVGQGQQCFIKDCPSARFLALAKQAARTSSSPDKALTIISGLDPSMHIDRWYILLCLLDLGAKPFWSRPEQATGCSVVQNT